MQRTIRFGLFALLVGAVLLAACAAQTGSAAAQAVEGYLNALIAKDSAKLSNLSCKDWESQATMEMDSFQAVTAVLEGVSCKETGVDGATTFVNCQGNIVATYNNEQQKLDLSPRTYKVTQEGGEWRVCGYR
jgi:hypothetical protein